MNVAMVRSKLSNSKQYKENYHVRASTYPFDSYIRIACTQIENYCTITLRIAQCPRIYLAEDLIKNDYLLKGRLLKNLEFVNRLRNLNEKCEIA